ncbi:hypothetical protein ABL78_1861 [Leptomonas seymouri]|uniref:Uncharacterized protein n=1 Tax=Leptomonas seymouri TaxID=5684 RepID=A0A0N1PEJ7_LEPSE|nr:hypothetical protein ABL78_1861 [Leptomonas seymouri]|eukprot:KPI89048.1 hypothetical protein ABL78_1861 [Leptomonas seymouri]
MGFGASKSKKDVVQQSNRGGKSSTVRNKPMMVTPPPKERASGTRNYAHSGAHSSSNGTPNVASPGEVRGFNDPRPARREAVEPRTNNRQTRMVGAEDMNGRKEDLDERPFRQEKVSRVPTKALLKPPKNPNSLIADPDDDYDLY